jgi:hypothetical protein
MFKDMGNSCIADDLVSAADVDINIPGENWGFVPFKNNELHSVRQNVFPDFLFDIFEPSGV